MAQDWLNDTHPHAPPPGLRITVGPFAPPDRGGGVTSASRRAEKLASSSTRSAFYREPRPAVSASEASSVDDLIDADGAPGADGDIGQMPAPAPAPAPVIDALVKVAGPLGDSDSSPAVNGASVISGTMPYPDANTAAPAVAAPPPPPKTTAGVQRVMDRLLKRKRPAPEAPPTTTPEDAVPQPTVSKAPAGDGGPAPLAAQDVSKAASAPTPWAPAFNLSSVLRAIGIPDLLTTANSLVVAGVLEKHAALTVMDDDSALYLRRDDVHPLALFWFLGARYGQEWLSWEPETIQETLRQDTGVAISDVIQNKIAAIKLVVNNTPVSQNDWHVFEKICVAFSGHVPRMSIVEDLDAEAMVFGVLCARGLVPGWTPSAELVKYMAARLLDAGFVVTPPALSVADPALQAMSAAPDPALRAAVLKRYAEVLGGGQGLSAAGEDERVNIQVARLLRCSAYALDRADDLVRQLA